MAETTINFKKQINSILVVCTGNICRSPMGEGILREKLKNCNLSHIRIFSAGTHGWDHEPPTGLAVKVCAEEDIDISGILSSPISKSMIIDADLILVMEKKHKKNLIKIDPSCSGKTFLITSFQKDSSLTEIDDPYMLPVQYYRKAFCDINRCLDGFIDSMLK
ncbi:low molecular weight protein-tyrosine-phosphatase [Desulfobacterales bacterium HSG16]|nr:low molecular weight protein-tyrosine-phosphatase [Desulfobacterales bacterium HSG16]